MSADQLILLSGLLSALLLAGLLLMLAWSRTGERPQIEASLRLLDREIREWTRLRKGEPEQKPLLLQMLHAANPIGRRLILRGSLQDLERQITYAGNPPVWTLDNIVSMKFYSVLVGCAIGLLFSGSSGNGTLIALVIILLGYEIPDLVIRQKATERQSEIRRGLPDILDLLTVTVEAGLGFDSAVAQVITGTSGPIVGEFSRYLQEKQIGVSSAVSLEALGSRSTVDELKAFAAALQQAERMGISVGTVLRELTREMRVKRRQSAQERAQKVPVKILGPMMLFIFPVIFIVVLAPAIISMMAALNT